MLRRGHGDTNPYSLGILQATAQPRLQQQQQRFKPLAFVTATVL